MSDNPKGYANPQLLITPEELSERLQAPGTKNQALVLLDLRPAESFAAGHIPGACHLDLFGVSLIDTDPRPLEAFLWMIAHLFASRGASADRTVIVYDEQSGMRAARAFWFLECFGHPDAHLLDGGFREWQRGGRPVATKALAPTSSEWAVDRVDTWLATWRDVRDRLGQAGRRGSRHAQRGRVLWHDGPCETRRRHSWRGSRRVDVQPGPQWSVQIRGQAPGDVRGCRGDARPRGHHVLSRGLSGRANLSRLAVARISSGSELHRLVEGMGGQGRAADRNPGRARS